MSRDDDRPKDLDAERAVLGAALVASTVWPDVVARVRAADFFRDAHRLVFAALAALAARGVPFDLVTVANELGTELQAVGGRSYLSSLVDGVPRSSNAGHYATIVREKARLRALAAAGETLTEGAISGAYSAGELALEAVGAVDRAVGQVAGGLVSYEAALADYLGAVSDGSAAQAITSGYADLDRLVGGFKPGDLVVVAGRPSTGKSSWALGTARAVAATGVGAVFFSREMTQRGLAGRLTAWETGVSTGMLERGEAQQEHYDAAVAAGARALPLYIQATAESVAEIAAWGRKAVLEGARLLVVDYLQLLVPERKRDSTHDEIAGISAALKRTAKELDVVVLALSQLSRAPEGRKDKRPTMADLRGSGAIEQDCDLGLLLFREEMHTPRPDNVGIAEVIVAKNRNGPTGVVRVQFTSRLAQFRDLAE
jgi:replicative DNA helicase